MIYVLTGSLNASAERLYELVSVSAGYWKGGCFLFSCLFSGDSSFRLQKEMDSAFKQNNLGVSYRVEVEVGCREATGGNCISLGTRNSKGPLLYLLLRGEWREGKREHGERAAS